MAKNNLIKIIIVVVVVGALGFYGGMQYQKSQRGSFPTNMRQEFLNGAKQQADSPDGRQIGMAGNRPISGEITSIDDNSVTIKTQDGSSKIIVYSDSTKINVASEGSEEDLKVGEQITAIGTEDSGTVTAQNITVGDIMLQRENSSQ